MSSSESGNKSELLRAKKRKQEMEFLGNVGESASSESTEYLDATLQPDEAMVRVDDPHHQQQLLATAAGHYPASPMSMTYTSISTTTTISTSGHPYQQLQQQHAQQQLIAVVDMNGQEQGSNKESSIPLQNVTRVPNKHALASQSYSFGYEDDNDDTSSGEDYNDTDDDVSGEDSVDAIKQHQQVRRPDPPLHRVDPPQSSSSSSAHLGNNRARDPPSPSHDPPSPPRPAAKSNFHALCFDATDDWILAQAVPTHSPASEAHDADDKEEMWDPPGDTNEYKFLPESALSLCDDWSPTRNVEPLTVDQVDPPSEADSLDEESGEGSDMSNPRSQVDSKGGDDEAEGEDDISTLSTDLVVGHRHPVYEEQSAESLQEEEAHGQAMITPSPGQASDSECEMSVEEDSVETQSMEHVVEMGATTEKQYKESLTDDQVDTPSEDELLDELLDEELGEGSDGSGPRLHVDNESEQYQMGEREFSEDDISTLSPDLAVGHRKVVYEGQVVQSEESMPDNEGEGQAVIAASPERSFEMSVEKVYVETNPTKQVVDQDETSRDRSEEEIKGASNGCNKTPEMQLASQQAVSSCNTSQCSLEGSCGPHEGSKVTKSSRFDSQESGVASSSQELMRLHFQQSLARQAPWVTVPDLAGITKRDSSSVGTSSSMSSVAESMARVFIRDASHAWLPATVLEYHKHHAIVSMDLPANWHKSTFSERDATVDLHVSMARYATEGKVNQLAMEHNVQPSSLRKVLFVDYVNGELPLQNSLVGGTEGKRDMADLTELHAASILYNLKERHYSRKPYTRVGDIVIAMNPFQWIKDLYSTATSEMYAKNLVWEAGHDVAAASNSYAQFYEHIGLEPHVFEVASLAYKGLATDGKDQTILVTGESGAGKTETVKIVMSYLATVEQTRPGGTPSANTSALEIVNQVCTSSPVFEAFGNAKTIRNDNSSRFGKFTKLQFSLEPQTVAKQAGRSVPYTQLVGCSCTTYLLEKSRVVSHDLGERSYHIFYQLLAAPRAFKEALWPEFADCAASDFAYLTAGVTSKTPSSSEESEAWLETENALQVFHFEGESFYELMRALGIVLQLGNLIFGYHHADDNSAVITSRAALDQLSSMSGITARELEATMTTRVLKTRGHDKIMVKLSPQVAKESCDALAKEIYGMLFDMLVRKINGHTEVQNEKQSYGTCGLISLLDIFGFENFETNRFEQLCINYANEKLHNKYVIDNFEQVKEEYEAEEIDLYDFALVDNSEVLQLLEGRSGLIESLNEECLRPKGNGESFVYRAKIVHQLSNRLINKKLHRKTEFGIWHFAGSGVTYTADKFVERNMDKIPDGLVACAMKTTNAIIRHEFEALRLGQVEPEQESAMTRKRSHPTVLEKFRTQLKSLMSSMESTRTRYIRCIKPNTLMVPRRTDHCATMRQLECSGILTAIAMSKECFPNKLLYEFILDRYACLTRTQDLGAIKELDQPREKVEYLLALWLNSLSKKNRDGTRTMPFACGRTMAFFKPGAQERLEVLRIEHFNYAATNIQTLARKVIAIEMLSRARSGARMIQYFANMVVDRMLFKRKRQAATRLAAWSRGRFAVRAIRQQRAATRIQAKCRSWPMAQHFRRSRKASSVIQGAYRRHRDRVEYARKLVSLVEQKDMDVKLLGIASQLKEGRREDAGMPHDLLREMDDIFAYLRNEVSKLRGKCDKLTTDLEVSETARRESDETLSTNRLQIQALTEANDGLVKEVFKERHEITKLRRDCQNKSVQVHHKMTVTAKELKVAKEAHKIEKDTMTASLKEAEKLGEERNHKLRRELVNLKETHMKEVCGLKKEIKKTQDSHKAYLDKLMNVLETTHAQREKDTEEVSKKLEEVKKSKDDEIIALRREIMNLRALHGTPTSPPRLPTPGRTHLLRKRLERNGDARARRSAQFDDVVQSLHSLVVGMKKGSDEKTATMASQAADVTEMVDILSHLYKSEEDSQTKNDQMSLDLIEEFVRITEPDTAVYKMQQRMNYMEAEMVQLRDELEAARMCPPGAERKGYVEADHVGIIYIDDTIYG